MKGQKHYLRKRIISGQTIYVQNHKHKTFCFSQDKLSSEITWEQSQAFTSFLKGLLNLRTPSVGGFWKINNIYIQKTNKDVNFLHCQSMLSLSLCVDHVFHTIHYVNIYVYAQIWTDSFKTKWNNFFSILYPCFLLQNYTNYLSSVQLMIEKYRDFSIISQFLKNDWNLFKRECGL